MSLKDSGGHAKLTWDATYAWVDHYAIFYDRGARGWAEVADVPAGTHGWTDPQTLTGYLNPAQYRVCAVGDWPNDPRPNANNPAGIPGIQCGATVVSVRI